jgi:hypothetical protein
VALCLCVSSAPRVARAADDDGLALYRDRFRLGMDRYKAGSLAEAIRIWSAIYEEIGPVRGYRLSFNLARAYDTNGEATRAAERYRSFLDAVSLRRVKGEPVEPLVEHEAEEAEGRILALNQEHGRIEITTFTDATLSRVDDADPRLGAFTAYVAPGKHVVTFGPGRADAEKVEVTVAAGELVQAHPTFVQPPRDLQTLPALDPVLMTRRVKQRPFSPVVLYVGGVASLGTIVVPVLTYAHANALYSDYKVDSGPAKSNAGAQYNGARTVAYGTLAIPLGLGAITGGLVTWYLAGVQERTVAVSANAAGGSVTVTF